MAVLDRVEGPECPACGCRASTIVKRYTTWGVDADDDTKLGEVECARRVCNHCAHSFTAPLGRSEPAERPVAYKVLTCPVCGSKDTLVTGTKRPIRHHKCRSCKVNFKSHEA